jgi:acylphosphatase
MTNIITRHLIICGRVQGVGFRAYVHGHAQSLGLNGFVRNRKDGTVEALVSGPENKIEALVAACHEGPPASRVSNVEVSEAQETAEKGFKHLPTA